MLIINTFVYGNISILDKYPNSSHYDNILTCLEKSMENRSLDNVWNVIYNIKLMKDKNLDINLLKFIKKIFHIFDKKFKENEEIIKDNINLLKGFIITEIKYSIICIQTFKHNDDIVLFFFENFQKEDIFCSRNAIYFNYNIPTEDFWIPYWKVSYLEDNLELDFIDIYTDNLIIYKNNQFESKECLENIIERLKYLKENAPDYFKLLDENYMLEYTSRVFIDYRHSDIIKNYHKFLEISDNVFIPDLLKGIKMDEISLFMSIIPERLLSYFLGLPYITGGNMSLRIFINRLELFLKNREEFYNTIYENNKKIIQSRCLTTKCGNAVDEDDILNVLFTPVNTYNIDDIYVIVSNDTDYIFNTPEFANILKTCSNPYNRENVTLYENYYMSHILQMKNAVVKQCEKMNLDVQLQGNMEEDFQNTFDKAKKNVEEYPKSPTFNNINISNQHMLNYMGPIITNFLNERMI